jgi:hypothetical protein
MDQTAFAPGPNTRAVGISFVSITRHRVITSGHQKAKAALRKPPVPYAMLMPLQKDYRRMCNEGARAYLTGRHGA